MTQQNQQSVHHQWILVHCPTMERQVSLLKQTVWNGDDDDDDNEHEYDGGGGFFPCLQGFWENVQPFIPPCTFFFF